MANWLNIGKIAHKSQPLTVKVLHASGHGIYKFKPQVFDLKDLRISK